MEYKNTIITPKTDFPMKAGLPAREPGMLTSWEDQDLYNARSEERRVGTEAYFYSLGVIRKPPPQ